MDDAALRTLLKKIQALERGQVSYRQGIVTDDNPLSVALGGSDVPYTTVKMLGSLPLEVGDTVSVLTFGNDLLVLGRVQALPGIVRGTTLVHAAGEVINHDLGVVPTALVATALGSAITVFSSVIGPTSFKLTNDPAVDAFVSWVAIA